jgi:TRAP-type C4-dicarboxylate transport system substrate-binding protein
VRAVIVLCLCVAPAAFGEPATLRVATVAPEGTGWAREVRAWSRDVEQATEGAVRIKVYFGGIAGNERTVLERIRRDQLDGTIGSELCTELAPSLKVGRVVGLFRTREENAYVLGRLKPVVDAEFLRAGFLNFGEAGLGPEVLFTREPVRDLQALQRMRLWIWDSDSVLPPQVRAMGFTIVQTALEQAGRSFDEGQFDGFITIPSAALAFQWTTQARYLTPMRISFRSACLIVAVRAVDALPLEVQRALVATGGKLGARVEELGRREDAALMSGLLTKHGMAVAPLRDELRTQFFELARQRRAGDRVVSEASLAQALSWLADYRAEHAASRPQ